MKNHFRYVKYEDYLKSENWENKKKEIRNGADGKKLRRCKVCKEWCFTEVHHKYYKRLGRERRKDLIEVCRKCHKEIHRLVLDGMRLYDASAHLKAKKRKIKIKECMLSSELTS